MTFEDTVNTQTDQDKALAELRASFQPTIAELRELKTRVQRVDPTWRARFAHIENRRQAALAIGARLSDLESLVRQLAGDLYLPGPLFSLVQQIEEMIARLESVSKDFLHHPAVCKPWYNLPKNVRALIGNIEQNLSRAEVLVEDGGDLHRQVAHVKGQAASVTAIANERSDETAVRVET